MVNWFDSNTKFYGLSNGVKDNLEKLTFESGKERTYLKNSSPTKTFKVSFLIWSRTDESKFWNWYENNLLSGSETFRYTNMITLSGQKEYKMTKTPEFENSQYPKVCNIELEEV